MIRSPKYIERTARSARLDETRLFTYLITGNCIRNHNNVRRPKPVPRRDRRREYDPLQRVCSFALLLTWLTFVDTRFVVRPGRSDLIYFRKGGEAQLPATIEGVRVVLAMPDGKIELARDDVRQIVPGFWPATEWEPRRRQARAESFEARFAAAWWAIENGLTTEVVPELRDLRASDSKHSPTVRMTNVLDRLGEPCIDPDFDRFQKALGIETRVARGPHVILLHQHSESEANERIELLERVITGYHLLFAAQGVELSVPRRRLVSAWLADQKDYLAFLRSEGAEAFATTRGYFHPTWNAVVAYDARSNEPQRTARNKLAAKRDELHRYGEMVERAPARSRIRIKVADLSARTVGRAEAKALLAQIDDEIACETLLLDLDRRAVDLGTAAHEMIHQLANDSGLLSRHDSFPGWLHEGLAAQFEVIRGGRWAGISRAHDLRLPDWRRLQSPLKLERLVRNAGFGHGYQRDLYAQAWALVYFLRTQHPEQFLTFIDLLRSPDIGGESPASKAGDRVFDAFQRAFGTDMDKLESDWHRFMRTVQTPLEQHDPVNDQAPKPSRPSARARN